MNLHLIVDFAYLYYKYKFSIESGRNSRQRLTKLTHVVDGKEIDMNYLYYPLREIEGFRKKYEKAGHDVVMSICFDSPSRKREDNKEYKANRINKLSETDFDRINLLRELLTTAGHNVYKIDGIEADDIVANIIKYYGNGFGFNIIYTPDTDLLACIKSNVGVYRYKMNKGYTAVGLANFSEYCSQEFKCNIPYNTVLLYKILCGDKSDTIKGVSRFGPAAFNKLIEFIGEDNLDWTELSNPLNVEVLIRSLETYLGINAVAQALESLELARFVELDAVDKPVNVSTQESRKSAYEKYGMTSII